MSHGKIWWCILGTFRIFQTDKTLHKINNTFIKSTNKDNISQRVLKFLIKVMPKQMELLAKAQNAYSIGPWDEMCDKQIERKCATVFRGDCVVFTVSVWEKLLDCCTSKWVQTVDESGTTAAWPDGSFLFNIWSFTTMTNCPIAKMNLT